ncbi:aminopeptidase P family protein [Paracoccus aerodenitrificans]|uniref:aminopeptidase P family protein n=1 Tax=Paracoccus aerodenitrificans TaxID=3017781 RepID=UPI0022F08B95|nr:aminopeptidase P family protein [Paracoccus aerodenitrificans]WBU65743.1 aminopeptidase P family protein [Paracoccus aerodenitrificans]
MFQNFETTSDVSQGGPRLEALRKAMAAEGLDAFMVPRADAHQGEYVADADARLRWLTGFSGSAGQAIVTADRAAVFVDGRYRVQVREQVDLAHFSPVNFPETRPATWLREALPDGGCVGFDPWLHTHREISELREKLEAENIAFVPVDNFVDRIWPDRPAPPAGQVRIHDEAIAGATSAEKRDRIAESLRQNGQSVAVLTLADSIAWLLNIRGADLPHNPVVLGFATIGSDGAVQLFADPKKFDSSIRQKLGNEVAIIQPDGFVAALASLSGPVRLDPGSAPEAVFSILKEQGTEVILADDPVILPKARKNPAEIQGMRDAHLADGAVMARFLCWLDANAPGDLTEIEVVTRLEEMRRQAGVLDISFETICGVGEHAALPHYRVSTESNAQLEDGKVLLVDSGGQYPNGTTDITRTVGIGDVGDDVRLAFTLVLQGMINLSRLRFPKGLSGRDIDPIARAALWSVGMDFDHGTGHGVGAALCVHEGPARISRVSEIPLETGMILSNEPGYYREGAFGIRTENLLAVIPADSPDGRDMLGFETLNFTPVDRKMILDGMLSPAERDWLNAYHAQVLAKIGPLVDEDTRTWLEKATAPL